jgi:hypothetical protein
MFFPVVLHIEVRKLVVGFDKLVGGVDKVRYLEGEGGERERERERERGRGRGRDRKREREGEGEEV